jgi:hypothetical protein
MTTKLPRHRVVIVAVSMALCSLAFGWTAMQVQHQADQNNHQSDQIDALAAALAAEQEAAENRGESPVAPDPEELIEDPAVEIPEAVGPSDEQVLEAVHAYFREHPVEDGKDASPADIVAAVVNYLSENPPEPGPPPTAEQLLSAVATYLQANPPPAGPPGADGRDGEDGEDGHTPTSAEIQAELAAYLEANPIKRCDDGWEYTVLTVLTPGPPTDIMVCTQGLELAVSGFGQRWLGGCLDGFRHGDGIVLGVVELDSQWPSDGVPESPDVPAAVVELPCLDYVVLPRAPVPVRAPPPCFNGAGHAVFLDQQRIIRHTYESTRSAIMPKKNIRLTVYAVVVIAAITVSGIEGVEPGTVDLWVDQAAKLVGAVGSLLAMLNLKDDAPKTPPAE